MHCDVLIIGAGPAGASLSYYLGSLNQKLPKKNRLKIVLIDKKNKLDNPVRCGELVPLNFTTLFDIKIQGINNQIQYMDTYIININGMPDDKINSKNFTYSFKKIKRSIVPAFMLDRDLFINDLVKRFLENDGILLVGSKVLLNGFSSSDSSNTLDNILNNFSTNAPKAPKNDLNINILSAAEIIKLKSKEYFKVFPKIIVAADGPLSSVRRCLNNFKNINNVSNLDLNNSGFNDFDFDNFEVKKFDVKKNLDFMVGLQERIKFDFDSLKKINIDINGYCLNVFDEILDLNSANFYFSPFIQGGYGWVFPKTNYLNIGVGVYKPFAGKLKEIFNIFKSLVVNAVFSNLHINDLNKVQRVNFNDAGNFVYQNPKLFSKYYKTINTITGIIPISGIINSLVYGNVVFIGDAAGLTNPITGAGIYNSVLSSKILSDVILDCFNINFKENWQNIKNECNECNIGSLKEFESIIKEEIGKNIIRAYIKKVKQLKYWENLTEQNFIQQNDFENLIKTTWPVFKEYYK